MSSRPYPRVHSPIDEKSMTQQHFTQQVNVNNIVEAYSATGVDLYAEHKATEKYGTVPSKTYFEALCEVKEFENYFNELPQHVREQFQNDPHAYYEALNQPISENTTPDKGSEEIVPPEATQDASAPQDSTPQNPAP